MTLHLGNVPASSTLYIPFHTFDSNGASITITGLAVTDIEIYKNGSTTQRSSDAGYTLLDTDGIDFDALTGIHGFSIDLSDNTDAGFYAVGSFYWVVVASVTVDTRTVNFVAATFRIVAAEGVAGVPDVNVTHVSDTAQTAGDIMADTNDIQARLPAALVGGRMDASVGAMATDVLTSTALAASAVTEIQSGLSTLDAAGVRTAVGLASANLDTQLSTIDDFLDTEVAAIKAKTDGLTFTVAGSVDANIQRVNDVNLTGDGAGTPWGPA